MTLGMLVVVVGWISSARAQMMVLPGKFDVNPLGDAAFSIPIAVPPGTGGMVPSLSLDYTSGNNNGLVGVGWAIAGLPAITRCPQTLAQDGAYGSITYDVGITQGQPDNDRFCLNGQRLVAISGNYGADGTEYRTEIESYTRIISHGYSGSGASPAYFDVYTKSGQIMEFGNTPSSHVTFANTSAFPNARSWLLDKVEDTLGNYLTVTYAVNPDTNVSNYSEVVPQEIDYTGNAGPALTPYNKVTFVYANGTRPDIDPLYTNGNLVETTQLLTDIKTWQGTPASPGSQEVNDYQLGYTISARTGRELLTSVTLCDGADKMCLPARDFGYQSSNAVSYNQIGQSSGLGSYPNTPPGTKWSEIAGDFVGNGETDFAFIQNSTLNVYLSNGNGTFTLKTQNLSGSFGAPPESSNPFANGISSPPTSPYFLIQGDFNGDGKSDFALIEPGVVSFPKNPNPGQPPQPTDSPGTIDTFLSNGDGTFNDVSSTFPYIATSTQTSEAVAGDFNGDRRTDFAILAGTSIYTFTSNGNGDFTEQTSTPAGGQNFTNDATSYSTFAGDFTGSGLGDFALISGSGSGNQIYSYLSNGNGTFRFSSQLLSGNLGSPPSSGWIPIPGDFTGDGLTDIAFVDANSIYVLLSEGNGQFLQSTQNISQNFGSPPQQNWTPIEGDFEGAGLTDFMLSSSNLQYFFFSNGNGTFSVYGNTIGSSFGAPPAANWTPIVGDFNGDGLTDFAAFSGSSLNTFLSQGAFPDLLTSITNGIGASTLVAYGTPAEGWGSYYSGYNTQICSAFAPSYPESDVAPSAPIVTNTSSSTGIGASGFANQYSSSYAYACARQDAYGRGFLGFEQQVVTDTQTGIEQTTDFIQTYPYIGLTSLQSKTRGSVTLNQTTNTYSALTPSSSPALPWTATNTAEVAPQFPYVSRSVSTNNDLNGAVLPTTTTTYSYDAYGNVLTVATSKQTGSTPGSSQTTTNTFMTPDTTAPNWILGRVTQSQVVSTTP